MPLLNTQLHHLSLLPLFNSNSKPTSFFSYLKSHQFSLLHFPSSSQKPLLRTPFLCSFSAGHFVEHLVGNGETGEIEGNFSGFGSEKSADSTEQRKLRFNTQTDELRECSSSGHFVEHLVCNGESSEFEGNFSGFGSEKSADSTEQRKSHFNAPTAERHFVEHLVCNDKTSKIEENISGFGLEKSGDSTEKKKLQFHTPTNELREFDSAGHFVERLVGNGEPSDIEENNSGFGSVKSADSTEKRKLQFHKPTDELREFDSAGHFVEHLVGKDETGETEENNTGFDSDKYFDSTELKKLKFKTPPLEVKELEELPENWRRSRIAWLCKELPSHKKLTLTRLLNAQKKWMRQDDATYIAVHCMRIRENEAAFWVYKWMTQQQWFKFDFALATKLADYIGRERKSSRCREMLDDIIKQGRVPSESTFHILIIAYLTSPNEDHIDKAFEIYHQMVNLGGYQPRLSLHNALFRTIINNRGVSAKRYLKQAEYIFHNLVTCGLYIHRDIYAGLLWLHSYQDIIDKDRMLSLRKEMLINGYDESFDVLMSILRACSKEGDVEEANKTWFKLLKNGADNIPSKAYVYKMEVHAKVGDYTESLKIFREMKGQVGSVNVGAYHKIIEIMCKAKQIEVVESLMEEFVEIGLMPILPSYVDLLNLYIKLGLHDKVEATFYKCLKVCRPNRAIYGIYLDSLVQTRDIEKAGKVFHQMLENDAIGVSSRSCNSILNVYLHNGDHVNAVKVFRLMQQKKFDVDPVSMEKVKLALTVPDEGVAGRVILKLTREQREILVGLLLGGATVKNDETDKKRRYYIDFEFRDDFDTHNTLRRHVYYKFHEWLRRDSHDGVDHVPWTFSTVPHSCFGFYGEQFGPNDDGKIPKLLHRWLSPCVIAYWYMYGGYRTSNRDIVLKVRGGKGNFGLVLKALKDKGLEFRVKKKGNVFWLGFLGSDSLRFWRLVEPHILESLKEVLKPDG